MKFLSTTLVLVLFLTTTHAARTTNNVNPCSMKCTSEDSLFKPGQKYIYSYQGESNIKTSNGLYDTTGVIIKSKVTITGLSNCEMKLSMSDVEVLDKTTKDGDQYQRSPNSENVKKVLEYREVFFTRSDMKVQSICMDKNEPVWSENIKKVLIDTLANQGVQTRRHQIQTTSHGKCFIEWPLEKELSSSETTVYVEYDIKNCKNEKLPQSIFTDFTHAMAFDVSRVACDYLYHNRLDIKSVKCKEEYKMNPLKQNGNKLLVEITTTLQKETQLKSLDQNFDNKNVIETGIEQNYDDMQGYESNYPLVKEVLKEICSNQISGTSSNLPKLFMKLVNQLKDLPAKEFKEIYLDISKNDICTEKQAEIRSIFYDAVGFVNTPASVSVMVDLIKTDHISLFDQNVWLTSLSFMQQPPTIEMLKDLETLLSVEKPTIPMYLGISAVTHLYCKDNFKSCISNPTIKTIVSKFVQNLNNDCSLPGNVGNDDLSKIQISLKALGNLKLFNDDVIAVLKRCVSTDKNPLSVRISALEVMKHMDCSKDRKLAMEILENNENDSELRINAYLTVMGCADINTLFKVREILAKEKVNQVGSFIWTHLTNIKESRDVLKAKIQELLNNIELKKEFDISKLKFSRNIEKTFKLKNMGMTFDSNIIFSEKSFIPRSVSLNTTSLILNKPSNLVEITARLEGLEDLLYKLFGPQGLMKKKSSAEDNVALINLLNEMSGNLNIKLYGQQISFIELVRGSISSAKRYNILDELMSWTQQKSFEINKNIQLIDKTAVLPTLLGFPLEVKLQGSVSLNIKIKSTFDVVGLFTWPPSFNINNDISPNINSELNADVALRTPFSKYGMRLNMKSGTNTEFKATVSANKNEEFLIKIDTPKTKQDLISVEGNAYLIHRNNKIPQLLDKLKEYKLCSSSEIEKIFGIKMCGTAKYLDSSYQNKALLLGPFSANVFIEKIDTQTGYLFQGSSKLVPFTTESGRILTSRFIKLELNTPNSKLHDRKFLGDLAIDFKENHVRLDLQTPWNQLSLMTTFKLAVNEKKIGFDLKVDKKEIVKIVMEHSRFSSEKRNIVKGEISATVLNFTPVKTSWNYESSDEQWIINFVSQGLMKDDTQFKMKVNKIKHERLSIFGRYQVSGFYNSYFGNGKISGMANENYYGHRWDVKVNHKHKESKEEFTFIFRHKTEDKSSKNLNKYSLMTTLAYGKNAENFVKFETENELSDKHIRISLKANVRNNGDWNSKPIKEDIEFQLYGGHKWKEEGRHYAEGSLTFKLPSRNLNYEGRYNSETSKRMFKLSLALDKDQQSSVNLKVNYLQPTLYLKDTELDATLSLPNNNLYMKWNLKEVDVNKYKYSFEGKYNKYDMKIDGVQTQISKLEHDSYISVEMPKIEGVPKQINIKCKINLVDLSKAYFQGRLEIPNTKHLYSINTQFSYMPVNFLQIASTDITSVFKYDIELSSIENSVKSKFIFTCNPEEFRTYFNLNLNAKNDPIEFDIHAMHKNPNYRQYNTAVRVAIQYPGNSHSLGLKSEFKYTEMMAQIDMTWNKNRRISINTMYEIDNSWTQKGLTGSLTIKTPFTNFEQIHLGLNAVGQLRYRKIDFEIKWGSGKKILFDIVIQPRSSSDFTMSFKLVTPFKGYNIIMFQTKHLHNSNSINTQSMLEIGPTRRYMINFEAVNNGDGKNRDYMGSIQIESGIYPPFKLSVLHKDDSVHFKTQFDATWMKTQFLKIKSDISYKLENYQLITKGNLELYSTIEKVKQMKTAWEMENRDGQFLNDIEILHNFNNIFKSSIKGFYETEPDSFKMEFNGKATVLNGRSMKIANNIVYQAKTSLQHLFSISQDTVVLYSHNFVYKPYEITLKVFVSNSDFKTIDIDYSSTGNTEKRKTLMSIKIGEKYLLKIDDEVLLVMNENRLTDIKTKSKYYSDYTSYKEIETKTEIAITPSSWKLKLSATSESQNLLKIDFDMSQSTQSLKYQITFQSIYKHLKNIKIEIEASKKLDGLITHLMEIKFNNDLKLYTRIINRKLQLINIDFNFKYMTHTGFLKFKSTRHVLGYENNLETDIFGKRITFSSFTESRGGFSLQTKFQGDLWFMKSLEVVGRFSKEKEITIIYQFSKDLMKNEKIKLSFSNKNGLYKFIIDSTSFLKLELKLDLKNYKTMGFEMKNVLIDKSLQIKLTVNTEGGFNALKHSSHLKLSLGDKKFEIENKVEKVKWKYLLMESEIKTNFNKKLNHKFGIEYNLKPSKFILDIKFFCNENFVKLSTNFDSSSESKMEIRIETSFPILQEINLDLKQKQNELFTQVTHKCRVVVKTQGNSLQIENDIEWSGLNFLTIQSSIAGQLSDSTYFIQPKSLKYTHQFHKNILKEDLQLVLSTNQILKVQLYAPFQSKSQSLFELESSFENFKKLSIDFNINLLESDEKSVSLKILRNDQKIIVMEGQYKNKGSTLSVKADLETVKDFKTNLKFELTNTNLGTKAFKGKLTTSFLKEAIEWSVKLNVPSNELYLSLNGFTEQKIKILGQISKNLISGQLTHDAINFNFKFELDKMFKLKTIEIILSKLANLNFKLDVSEHSIKLTTSLETNSINIDYKYRSELDANFKLINDFVKFKISTESADNERKFLIDGTSSLNGWSSYKTNVEWKFETGMNEIKAFFNKEQKNILKIDYEHKISKSCKLQYSSAYEPLKSGKLEVIYENLPNELVFKFNANSKGEKSIEGKYKLDGSSFIADITSSFEWFKTVRIEGQLINGNDEAKGSFSIQHNKLNQPINGEFALKRNLNIFKLEVKTPLSQPYDQVNFIWERSTGMVIMELSNKIHKLLTYKFKNLKDRLYQFDIDMHIPKPEIDLKLTFSATIDLKLTKNIILKIKSNRFEELNLEISLNPEKGQFKILFSNPLKEGQLELKISTYQLLGKQIEILTQYGDIKNEVELVYEVENMNSVYVKSVLKSTSFFSSDLSFETSYKHKIDLPNTFNLDIQNKFNGKIISYKSVSWHRKADNSFDFLSKLILSPNDKEYESKIDLSNKQGEIISLTISAAEILKEEINVRIGRKQGNLEFSLKSPFELIKSVQFTIEKEQNSNIMSYRTVFLSNKLGKYETITEYKIVTNADLEISFQLNTPSTNKKLFIKSNLKNTQDHQLIATEVQYDSEIYKIHLSRQNQHILLKFTSPFENAKIIQFAFTVKPNSYEFETTFNQYMSKMSITQTKESMLINIETNTEYLKALSILIENLSQSQTFEVKFGEEYFKIIKEIDTNKKVFKYSMKNNLINFLPKSSSGMLQYSLGYLDVKIEVTIDEALVFELNTNSELFYFNTRLANMEVKINISMKKLEIIYISKNIFSVLIEETPENKINAYVMINGNQYSLITNWEIKNSKLSFQLFTYKNSVNKLVIIKTEVDDQNINVEISYQSQNILQFKLMNKRLPNLVWSLELSSFDLNAVGDLVMSTSGPTNVKVSWNILYKEKQLHLGSVNYGMKFSKPINYLVAINLQNMAYQVQLLELDSGEIQFKLSTPFKPFDINIQSMITSKVDLHEIWVSVENSVIGEYNLKASIQVNKDPEIKFLLSSTTSIIKYKLRATTSISNQFSLSTMVQIFDWEKIELTFAISTKELTELLMTFKSPLKVAKDIQIKKTINYISLFEHKYETEVVYDGLMKVKYIGVHEIYLSKKVFKLQGNFHNDETKILSLNLDHTGNHNSLDHSFIWHFKEQKFGYRLNGGFTPLFEGKSEIYTPFHETGKVVLLGKQVENGVQFEAGKNDEKMASFEYTEDRGVKMMKITPPEVLGKPLAVRYKLRRFKRSTGNEMLWDINYGTDNILKLSSKVQMDKDKYSALFNADVPKISQHPVELSLSHTFNKNKWDFDHHFKIKDVIHRVYRIFGNLLRDKSKTFSFSLSTEHPTLGVAHLSAGHSIDQNNHKSHFLAKLNENTLLKHEGDLKLDSDKYQFNGDWKSQILTNYFNLGFSHTGAWNKFSQNLLLKYNEIPYLQYKSQIVPYEKSNVEVELLNIAPFQLKLMIDSSDKVLEIFCKTTTSSHFIEIINKDGELKASYKKDDTPTASVSFGYATQPLYFKGKYLKRFVNIEMTLENSLVIVKLESSCNGMKKASLKMTKNKVIVELNRFEKPYSMEAEYNYTPNNFVAIIKTSLKQISNFELHLKPDQGKIIFNELYLTFQYVLKSKHIQLTSKNNFLMVKNVLIETTWESLTKASIKFEMNSFMAQSKFEVSNEKSSIELENNYFEIRNVELELSIKRDKDFYHSIVMMSINKAQKLKAQFQLKDSHYSIGLETYLNQHFIVSYNKPSQELIISLKSNSRYLNIIHNIREMLVKNSKTLIMEFNVDSSSSLLEKFTNEFTYTVTDSTYYLKTVSTYNKRKLQLKAEISKVKLFFSVLKDETEYRIAVTRKADSNLDIELLIPGHITVVKYETEKEKYVLNVKCDERQIFNINIKQKLNFKTSIKHQSVVEYYSKVVWDMSFNTDLKKYEIKFNIPFKIDLSITNDWKRDDMTTLAFLCKYTIDQRSSEFGAGISFLLTSKLRSLEVYLQNDLHVISWKQTYDTSLMKRTRSIRLTNTKTKEHWELTVIIVEGKQYELTWKTPTATREIKFHQTLENNVPVSIYLDVLGYIKYDLKSDQKAKNILTGSLSLFSTEIATIEKGKDYLKIVLRKDNSEDKAIHFKLSSSSEGEWKKNFVSVKKLEIKQKSLNINIDVTQKTVVEKTLYSSLFTINYQTISGAIKTLELGTTVNFSQPNKLMIEVRNPLYPVTINLQRVQPTQSLLRYEMESYSDLNDKITGYFELNTGSNPGLTSRLYYNPKNPSEFFHAHSKFIDDRQMEAYIYTKKDNQKTVFFQFLVRLLNERTTETTFEMKRNILNQVLSEMDNYLSKVIMKQNELLISESQWIIQENRDRDIQFLNNIPSGKDIQNQYNTLLRNLVSEINKLKLEIRTMRMNNEFYFASIYEITKDIILESPLVRFIQTLPRKIDMIQSRFLDTVQGVAKFFAHLRAVVNQAVFTNIRAIFAYAESWVVTVMDAYLPKLQDYVIDKIQGIKTAYDFLLRRIFSIESQIRKFSKLIFLSHTYKVVDNTVDILRSIVEKLSSGTFDFLKSENEIRTLFNDWIDKLSTLSAKLLTNINAMMNQADNSFDYLTGDKFFYKVGNMLSTIFDYCLQQMKDKSNQNLVRDFLVSMIQDSFTQMGFKFHGLTLDIIMPYYVVIEPMDDQVSNDNSLRMVVQFNLPIPMNNFKSFPDFGVLTRKINKIKSVIETTKKLIRNRVSSGYKFIEKRNWFALYIPTPSFPSLLPEFESYATISKSSVVTFDKQSFQIKSDACSVSLSKDIRYKRWDIILNQDKDKRSFTVNMGQNTFELSATDYKVKHNGKPLELPFREDSLSLIGFGRLIKLTDNNLGLTITLDPVNEMFTVGISQWYHGKVRGLFGNADNEPFNDFMLENGKIVSSEIFMKSFNNQGKSCSIMPEVDDSVQPVEGCPFLRRLTCQFLFKCPLSPLATCFKTVNPSKFLKKCISGKEELLTKLDPSVCKAVRQYQSKCKHHGIKIPVPLPCQKCDIKNENPLPVDEYRNIKIKDKVSDIVFIVDEGDCVNSLKNKLPDLVKELEKDMKVKGISSVNFGLVTFIDDYFKKAIFHTVGQKLLGTSEDMAKSILSLTSARGIHKDLVGALELAHNYPFREHASRHIIMVSCRGVTEHPIKYQSISDRLREKAIHFTLLTNFQFKMKDENKNALIFGVDPQNMYTSLSRNGERNSTVRPEKDFLYKLTMSMKGIVFDYNFLNTNQPQTEKRFISALANQISQRATPARSTRCTCVADGEYVCVPQETYTIFPVKNSSPANF